MYEKIKRAFFYDECINCNEEIDERKQLFINLNIIMINKEKYFKCKLNSGASCNVISLKDYKKMSDSNLRFLKPNRNNYL